MPAQVSFVGVTEEAARENAQKNGYADKLAITKTSFKANSKVWSTLVCNLVLLNYKAHCCRFGPTPSFYCTPNKCEALPCVLEMTCSMFCTTNLG